MALWNVNGQLVDDTQEEGRHIPENATRVQTFRNQPQYGDQEFAWEPENRFFSGNMHQTAPGYLTELFGRLDRQRSGQLKPYEAEELAQWEATARAMPTRDISSLTSSLTAAWQGENRGGEWDEQNMWRPYDSQWWSHLDPGSPDVGPIMLALRDKGQAGTATPQERALYEQVRAMAQDWNFRASAPQESDANPFGLGDNLFGALFTLGLGASGGLAAAPLVAGGASLGTTLGSLGTLAGTAGSLGNLVAPAIDQDWFSRLTQGLGAAGGIAGGVGGLANLWGTGIQGLGDAARLASSAGRVVGGVGGLAGSDALRQGAGYLGAAGGLGSGANTIAEVFGGGVSDLTDAARLASGFGQVGGAVGSLSGKSACSKPVACLVWAGVWAAACRACLGPQDRRSSAARRLWHGPWSIRTGCAGRAHRGRGNRTRPRCSGTSEGTKMAEWWEWTGEPGPWESNAAPDLWAGGSPTFNEAGGGNYFQSPAYQTFTGWGDPTGPGTSGESGGGFSLGGLLGGIGGLFSGAGGGIAGPLLSSLGSLGGGAIGSNAANEAARLQSEALNRGLDLQTAQWLQQQGNLAPYLQAGQGGLAQLQQLAGREQPSTASSYPTQVQRQWYDYGVPPTTPGWTPQNYAGPQGPNAGDYRWNPQEGPQAANYRYMPGQTPDAAAYRYTPGAVPTLSGQELLANDPGVAFRMAEGRKALEASAAAKGGLLSGPTLAALQRQGQELGSQEYGQAWNRASQQAQLREQWGQAESQMGFQQAEAASRLREQVNQIASQQGWSQAQAEAVFREQQAQLASQQGWNQALQGQQNQFTQGLDTSKWNTLQQQQYAQEQYKNMLTNNQLMYGRDTAENQTNYDREQQRYRQQLAQHLLPWEQASTLATLGGQAVGMYGQQGQGATNAISNLLTAQGTAQAGGATNQANSWMNALQNVGGAAQGYFGNQAYEQGRQSVLSGINR